MMMMMVVMVMMMTMMMIMMMIMMMMMMMMMMTMTMVMMITYTKKARCLAGPFGVRPCLCSKPHVRCCNKRPRCLSRSVSVCLFV